MKDRQDPAHERAFAEAMRAIPMPKPLPAPELAERLEETPTEAQS